MRAFIVVTEDGKRHAVMAANIKSIEHVAGEPGTPAQAAQEAREGHPGEPAIQARAASPGVAAHPAQPGKPPVKAQEAKEAVKANPGVKDSVIIHLVDGESLTVKNLGLQQVVDQINSDSIVSNAVLGSPNPARAQQAREGREGHDASDHAAGRPDGTQFDGGRGTVRGETQRQDKWDETQRQDQTQRQDHRDETQRQRGETQRQDLNR